MSTSALLRHLEWLRIRGLSPETVRQRSQRVRTMFRLVGEDDPRKITAGMLADWQATLLRYPPQTRATYTSHTRAFFAWCAQTGEVRSDPSVNLARPKVPRALPRPISEGALELAMETADDRMRAMLALSAYAGLRAGEIARLARRDVLDGYDPPVLVIRKSKGGGERVVPAGETVLDALHAWGLRPGFVFPGPNGHLSPGTVSNRISEHLKSLGFDATSHQGRHRFLTEVYRASRDLRLTQELAGHASPTSTAIYTAFASERAIDAVRALDKHDEPVKQLELPAS